MTDDIAFLEIGQLQRLLESGALSAVELTEASLRRLEQQGPRYNAVATVLRDRAHAEAVLADRRRRRLGSSPMLGIPYGAKDLLAARGGPTTYGSAAFQHQRLDYDAAVIAKLRRAGAVLSAKLSLMELAAFHALDPAASLHGPCRNPWDLTRWAGGSSSGSGAAVGAGLVPFALGSETGGSIGTPSAYCGITGLRPTYGLVSRFGAMPLSWSLDKVGPMARSAHDCGLVLEVIAGPDKRDDSSSRRTFRHAGPDAIRREDLGALRVGYALHDIEEAAAPEIRPALRDGMAALRDLGLRLDQAELPPDLPYLDAISVITGAEGASAFGSLIESDRLELVVDHHARSGMRESMKITARSYLNAMRIRKLVQEAFRRLFERVDLLVTYSLPWAPTPIDRLFTSVPISGGLTAMVAASNLAGLPAIFLPVGLTAANLPVGIQLVAPPFQESRLLSVGMALQSTTAWHRLRPPAGGQSIVSRTATACGSA